MCVNNQKNHQLDRTVSEQTRSSAKTKTKEAAHWWCDIVAAPDAAEPVPDDNSNQNKIDNNTADDKRESDIDDNTCMQQQADNIVVDAERDTSSAAHWNQYYV